jgi:hypothetical protein
MYVSARQSGNLAGDEKNPTRKQWIKKTPVQVVLDQIAKQQEKVDDLGADLTREERGLAKLQKAKAVLEAD